MTSRLQQIVSSRRLDPAEIDRITDQIYETIIRHSRHLDRGNFSVVHPDDLERMFDLYDELFLDGGARDAIRARGEKIEFRLSKRMTKSGGKTTRYRWRPPGQKTRTSYEIALSTVLLFQTFGDVQRNVTVSGVKCRDRLQAMQRIVEHELIHLVEMLLWTDSNCAEPRFQSITSRLFRHTEHTHDLITVGEVAHAQFGIRPGDRVRFRMDGVSHVGVVNRITRRATILVEDPSGARYSDGKRYAKFYVPLPMLEPCRLPK